MNSLRIIINSKSLSRKIQFPSSTTCTQVFLRLRQKSTSTTSTNTSFSQSRIDENITVWNVYGPPLVNCFLIGSITYISLQVMWYKLAFIELREEMENKVNELENKINYLRKNNLEVD
ncbi:hypothetical protein RhiirA5_29541 [Rhizophagus irregularis]|uniref:Uncharacterized protein n=2 Tax=Rhizophagus irregularis TaxID=588596 RepID=A0A2I1GE84_9GLOM|nr:hypothetical protein GLOIN_2v1782692 [Rhizophagus irregularis DAOM 181602=DAOM 197198]PKC17487.1 hypothetical protein RhiirA5_29541 [Rhizophagus irregularis]PKC71737.1 hypothetical protein RhiirA1_453187 [Rhizophagus irregularis]PKK80275.1 hypothetical protein RhiirC2_768241 [Rhizophagus irregularis]PKY13503.1 hypothetical protein RhiirB3_425339 [Rhizophagus irregularis]PKY44943.1 hypothetical protein RhiirA4_459397 [Rhizophagus irregularis]|eukprot:XP_025171458.1 hypothetical protein GLOIN_2v1782692 [Rhizophagus irregularis DAOM 181602=DAOM 197198]